MAVASLGRRFCAWLIDLVAVSLVVLLAAAGVTAVIGPTLGLGADPTVAVPVSTGRAVLHAGVATGLVAAYFAGCWVRRGATPGQLLLGIRVRRAADDGRLPLGRALRRWVVLLPPLGTAASLAAGAPLLGTLLWAAVPVWQLVLLVTTARSATGQGLHDRAAGSVVVRAGAELGRVSPVPETTPHASVR